MYTMYLFICDCHFYVMIGIIYHRVISVFIGDYCDDLALLDTSGPCAAGFYCTQGSDTHLQFICPQGRYCPEGRYLIPYN